MNWYIYIYMYIYIPNKRLPPFFSKSNQVLTFSPSRFLSKALLSRSPPNLWFTFRGGAPGTLHSLFLHSSVPSGDPCHPFHWRHRGPLLWSCIFSLGVAPGMVEYLLLGAGTYKAWNCKRYSPSWYSHVFKVSNALFLGQTHQTQFARYPSPKFWVALAVSIPAHMVDCFDW